VINVSTGALQVGGVAVTTGGVSLTGSTNNTITTVTGAGAIQGEANLTFDGSTLAVAGAVEAVGAINRFSRADTTPAGTASTVADDAVFGSTDTTNTGITILGSGQTEIAFGDSADTDTGAIRYQNPTDTLDFISNNSVRGKWESDGGFFLTALLAASASTDVNINGSNEIHSVTSSAFYKDKIRPLELDTSKIHQLMAKSFTHGCQKIRPDGWPEPDKESEDFGLIAEEVAIVLPELVNYKCEFEDDGNKGTVEILGTEKPYSIKYGKLSEILLVEVQKLTRRVAVLEIA
jgi:hypothetical protein